MLSQRPAFYRKALVDLDQKTLSSPQMVQAFETIQKIRTYFDKGYHGRGWNLATAMVISGSSGMQFMGDWAKGEFANASWKADVGYFCAAAPGTSNAYTYTADAFVFFQQNDRKEATAGQLALAKTMPPRQSPRRYPRSMGQNAHRAFLQIEEMRVERDFRGSRPLEFDRHVQFDPPRPR